MTMFKALLSGLVVGVVSAYIAWGGGGDLASYGKALVIGLVSAFIAHRAAISLQEIAAARLRVDQAGRILEHLRKSAPSAIGVSDEAKGMPELQELEASTLARGAQPNVSDLLSRRLGDRLLAKIPLARTTSGSAVYVGLGGTLLGLTFAVLGLRNLADDADKLKTQILSVVSGFGGSFACAFCGIVVTVWLSAVISRHDAAVAEVEASAEAYVAEVLLPALAPEKKMAELVAETVTKGLSERLDGFWNPLIGAATRLEAVAESIKKHTEQIALAAIGTKNITAQAAETSKDLATAAAQLVETSQNVPIILKAVNASAKALNEGLTRLEPAFLATSNLSQLTKEAEGAMRDVSQGVKGIAAAVREETKVAAKETTDEIALQQRAMRAVLEPPLAQIATSLDMLRLVLVRTEEAARDLPIAVPAARIVDDLRAVAADQEKAMRRDAATVDAAAERLARTEERIGQAIGAVRSAHEELQRSLASLGGQTGEVARHLGEVSERLETPFWKRLAGRKP